VRLMSSSVDDPLCNICTGHARGKVQIVHFSVVSQFEI
jgi:hypothetical protein